MHLLVASKEAVKMRVGSCVSARSSAIVISGLSAPAQTTLNSFRDLGSAYLLTRKHNAGKALAGPVRYMTCVQSISALLPSEDNSERHLRTPAIYISGSHLLKHMHMQPKFKAEEACLPGNC